MILNHPTTRTSHGEHTHTGTYTHTHTNIHAHAHAHSGTHIHTHTLTKLARVRLLRYTHVARKHLSLLDPGPDSLCTGGTGAVAGHSLQCQVQLFARSAHRTSVSITARPRRWSSGRILPCHGRDPGSIPGRRTDPFSLVGLYESCAGSKCMRV